ncbi:unnamed protein product, partial [Symbiodinium microadriaticum]
VVDQVRLAIARQWASLEEKLPLIREHYARALKLHTYVVENAKAHYAEDAEQNELQSERLERWRMLRAAKQQFYEEDRRYDDLCACFEIDAEECLQQLTEELRSQACDAEEPVAELDDMITRSLSGFRCLSELPDLPTPTGLDCQSDAESEELDTGDKYFPRPPRWIVKTRQSHRKNLARRKRRRRFMRMRRKAFRRHRTETGSTLDLPCLLPLRP